MGASDTESAVGDGAAGRRRRIGFGFVVVLVSAAFLGFGIYTFTYAEGGSYLSSDPSVCANCHIMQGHLDSWQKASHHGVATCNDCHLPASGLARIFAKVRNGWNHSTAFTLQNFAEPIRATDTSKRIIQENCLRCHGDLTHAIAAGPDGAGDPVRCTHCHGRVGHGDRAGLGGPFRESEIPEDYR